MKLTRNYIFWGDSPFVRWIKRLRSNRRAFSCVLKISATRSFPSGCLISKPNRIHRTYWSMPLRIFSKISLNWSFLFIWQVCNKKYQATCRVLSEFEMFHTNCSKVLLMQLNERLSFAWCNFEGYIIKFAVPSKMGKGVHCDLKKNKLSFCSDVGIGYVG